MTPPAPPVAASTTSATEAVPSSARSLTSLAPDIIEAILRGDEPAWLSLKNLPVRWDEQGK